MGREHALRKLVFSEEGPEGEVEALKSMDGKLEWEYDEGDRAYEHKNLIRQA